VRLSSGTNRAPAGLDPWLSAADFSVLTQLRGGFDVVPPCWLIRPTRLEPAAHYLALDYQNVFHAVDQLPPVATSSGLARANAPDLMSRSRSGWPMFADYLSYFQDAGATEPTRDARAAQYRSETCPSTWIIDARGATPEPGCASRRIATG